MQGREGGIGEGEGKGWRGKGRGREGKGKRREEEKEGKGKRRGGARGGVAPLMQIPGSAPVLALCIRPLTIVRL